MKNLLYKVHVTLAMAGLIDPCMDVIQLHQKRGLHVSKETMTTKFDSTSIAPSLHLPLAWVPPSSSSCACVSQTRAAVLLCYNPIWVYLHNLGLFWSCLKVYDKLTAKNSRVIFLLEPGMFSFSLSLVQHTPQALAIGGGTRRPKKKPPREGGIGIDLVDLGAP